MITEAVGYRDEDREAIGSFESSSRSTMDPNHWSNGSLDDVRSYIKSHYIRVQATRCCYCNRMQATDHHRLWDVEHVVPRSTHPQFMFTPQNLAASCVDCNQEKGDTQVLANARRATYPEAPEHFKIVHPHFDEFEVHIYRDGHIYMPMTEKGNFTIRTCNLLRFAQKYINWPSVITDDRFERDVDAVMADGSNATSALRRISQQIL